jgi:hypothetical protein
MPAPLTAPVAIGVAIAGWLWPLPDTKSPVTSAQSAHTGKQAANANASLSAALEKVFYGQAAPAGPPIQQRRWLTNATEALQLPTAK